MTQNDFFTVHHSLTVNIEPLAADYTLPSMTQFVAEIPAPFIVASEFSQLDHLTDNARSELKNNDFKHVINLLDTQNTKLNLLLTFMLSQQDQAEFRGHTSSFGASQFTYLTQHPLSVGQVVRAKLFLEHPPAAIYCYASVTSVKETDNGIHEIQMKYDLLRDSDQDLLIKAALYQQQKLLRQRSLDRENK